MRNRHRETAARTFTQTCTTTSTVKITVTQEGFRNQRVGAEKSLSAPPKSFSPD